jgi:cell division control protein 24
MNIEDGFDRQTLTSRRTSVPSIAGLNSSKSQPALADTPEATAWKNAQIEVSGLDFTDSLEASQVYRRAQRDTMDYSFRSSVTMSRAWSILSDFSLGDISAISVIALPIYQNELTNAQRYAFGGGAEPVTTENETVQPVTTQPVAAQSALKIKGHMVVECFDIILKMNQLPECEPHFRGLSLSPDSAFDELWMVLCQGMPLLKLLQALDPQFNLQPTYQTGFLSPVAMIQRFLGYCRTILNVDIDHIFTLGMELSEDVLGFWKVSRHPEPMLLLMNSS